MANFTYEKFGNTEPSAPLIVLLHGRGANELSLFGLAKEIDPRFRVISLRGPIELAPNSFTWFQNRGIGRPIPESLRQSLNWFYQFCEIENPLQRPVTVVGFSGGAAFAGAIALDRLTPLAGAAILYGTIPFDAGLPVEKDSLREVQVFVAQGKSDSVMPPELMERTWEYLHSESGSNLEAHKSDGGHEITADIVDHLNSWIASVAPATN
ncbi:MAG: serine esterase [Actinomycetota bacterium]|nr:serine esterase [Actinomycetota bacterium]